MNAYIVKLNDWPRAIGFHRDTAGAIMKDLQERESERKGRWHIEEVPIYFQFSDYLKDNPRRI